MRNGKRLLGAACLATLLFLAGCDIIWQGITGKGYYQVTRSTAASDDADMKSAAIDLSGLATDSVIVFKTSANSYYGKLSYTALDAAGLTIKFVTYAADGSTLKSSNGATVTAGSSFSLETGAEVAASATSADLTFTAPATLTPVNNAVFYAIPD
jgi:hypothetical protein